MENHVEHVHQILVPDLFLILVNNPKQLLHAINSFKNKMFWKNVIKKPYFCLFFRIQSLFMSKIMKNKRGLELVTSRASGYKIS